MSMTKREPKAQIGYTYDGSPAPATASDTHKSSDPLDSDNELDANEDLDLAFEIDKLTAEHKVILNKNACNYGMEFGDYVRMLIVENEERESLRRNKLLDAEKAKYSVLQTNKQISK